MEEINSPWHMVDDGDLPKDGQHILYHHRGLDLYDTIYYPEPPITDIINMDYWMEIPKLPKNKIIKVANNE